MFSWFCVSRLCTFVQYLGLPRPSHFAPYTLSAEVQYFDLLPARLAHESRKSPNLVLAPFSVEDLRSDRLLGISP